MVYSCENVVLRPWKGGQFALSVSVGLLSLAPIFSQSIESLGHHHLQVMDECLRYLPTYLTQIRILMIQPPHTALTCTCIHTCPSREVII